MLRVLKESQYFPISIIYILENWRKGQEGYHLLRVYSITSFKYVLCLQS